MRIFNQPRVVGEIIAGICLGPSVLGWAWPSSSTWLFSADSMKALFFLSQIGLAFFMFIVGTELETANMQYKKRQAVVISHISILVPFFLGVCLSYYLYPLFATSNVSFLSFALFMGIAMSITAFPVLARIVQERNLSGTPIGNLAITCAAADDITAWCMLAAIVATAKSASISSYVLTVSLSLIYVLVMLFVVRPGIRKMINRRIASGSREAVVAIVFIVLLISALVAELIGIHALFGAFLTGVIMPANKALRQSLIDKVRDVSKLLLLPIFFAYTGLRTQIGLIEQQNLWFFFALIMIVAVSGKFGGSAISARLVGLSWRDALSIGALLNTRGLMELVVLNIGYELKILPPEIFTLMVLMALGTTLMTGPLLSIVYRAKAPVDKKPETIKLNNAAEVEFK